MRRMQKVVLGAMVLFPVVAGVALATPGINVIGFPPVARGTAGELNVHSKSGVKLQSKSSVDFVTQQIVLGPGGSTGWHSHPGPVLVTIKAGEMTLVYADEANCDGRIYRPGDSFVDRGDEVIHNAFNRGPINLEFWATYLVPGEPGTAARIDATDPGIC